MQTWNQTPVRYVEALAEYYGAMGHPPYRWTVNDDAPFQPLGKPVSECRVSMLTSGGISQRAMPAWDPLARNDHRLDAIPADAASDDFQIHDAYYDHGDADQDLNCQFPIDRLRELCDDGSVGELAPRFWSGFMGRIYDRSRVINESAPAFADALGDDEVDLLIAVPA
ncbi:MAG: glycine/sarcosine/betaine reductase selenoprotein B family protein [Gammaproteobacteria bacterium]